MNKKPSKLIKSNPVIYISMTKDGYFALGKLFEFGKKIDLIITLPKDESVDVSDYIDFSSLSDKYQIPIKFIANVNNELSLLQSLRPSLIIINGWSQLLSPDILSLPKCGCIGTHPALLPKNRGRAPIAWHFINEEKFGGVTLFYLGSGCDDGPIIDQVKFPIYSSDNASTYYEKITDLGAKLLVRNYDKIISGIAMSRPQNDNQATYLLKRRPQDSLLDFSETARQVHNKVRAVSGIYPSAFFHYQGNEYHTLRSVLQKTPKYSGVPGQIAKVTDMELWVLASDKIIILADIQDRQGKPVACSKIFRTGYVINE